MVPILLGSGSLAFAMAKRCNAHGAFAMPVAYPAVAVRAERLRMNLTCDHRRQDLDFAPQVLVAVRAALERDGGRAQTGRLP